MAGGENNARGREPGLVRRADALGRDGQQHAPRPALREGFQQRHVGGFGGADQVGAVHAGSGLAEERALEMNA